MLRAWTIALLPALALALPAAAPAVPRAVAPPGNSEADQYFETLPATSGPRAPNTAKKARDAVRDGSLTEASEHALRRRGPRGLALATAVARTAPPGAASSDRSRRGPHIPAATVPPPSEPGLGALFPVLLIAAAAAALAFALTRRRGRPAR
jgi:hypothetical protein